MRHGQSMLLGVTLLAALLAGCHQGGPQRSTSWMDRFRPFQGTDRADVIMLDVALVEQPVLDSYVNTQLWYLVDEGGPWEGKAQLEDNGFRSGQVGGITPPDLQALLTSERTCPSPRRIQTRTGNPKELTLGPVAESCRFWRHQDGDADELSFDKAEYSLVVTPTLGEGNRVILRFVPQIRHGEVERRAIPTADRTALIWQAQRATRTFPELAWEVTVPTNEYVVVGAYGDKAGTLGCEMFVRRDETKPVQRLLVIRTARSTPGVAEEFGDAEVSPRTGVSPSCSP